MPPIRPTAPPLLTNGVLRWAGTALLSASVLSLIAAASAPRAPGSKSPDLRAFYAQKIAWENCGDDMTVEYVSRDGVADVPPYVKRFECGTFKAPLDYANPQAGKTTTLSVVRLPSTGKEKPQGSVVVNFGGPGFPGIRRLNTHGDQFAALNARYDIVAPDLRGTGQSDPQINCQIDAPPVEAPSPSADARADAQAQYSYNKAVNSRCGKASSGLLPWVGTNNTARDLDFLRDALGEDKLNYWGMSYGTQLGAVYMHQFPQHAGRLALDGVVDPSEDPLNSIRSRAKAFQTALDRFIADCVAEKPPRCPLGESKQDAQRKILDLFQQLPHTANEAKGLYLSKTSFTDGVSGALQDPGRWPGLRQALTCPRTRQERRLHNGSRVRSGRRTIGERDNPHVGK